MLTSRRIALATDNRMAHHLSANFKDSHLSLRCVRFTHEPLYLWKRTRRSQDFYFSWYLVIVSSRQLRLGQTYISIGMNPYAASHNDGTAGWGASLSYSHDVVDTLGLKSSAGLDGLPRGPQRHHPQAR